MLFGLSLALGGCSRAAPPSQFPSADQALERMHATYACSRGVRGEAKLDYFGEAGHVRGDLLYLAMLPDHVRLDVVSPFGATLSTLTSDGQRFSLYDLRQKQFLQGPANECNLARFTNVPMPPHALVQLLRGEAPVLLHEPGGTRIEWRGGRYVLDIDSRHAAHETIELLPLESDWNRPFAEQHVIVLGVHIAELDVRLYDVELRGHRQVRTAPPWTDPDGLDPPILPSGPSCSVPVPTRIRIEVPEVDHDLLLENKETVLNPPLQPGAFGQEVPSGVAVRESRCGGRP